MFDGHDAIHILASFASVLVTVAVIRTDIKWIRKWCDDHERDDERNFHSIQQDIRDLRHRDER